MNVNNILLSLGMLPAADQLPYGYGLVASGQGPAPGNPWPGVPGVALDIHGAPAIVQPYMAEDDQPYVVAYDQLLIFAENANHEIPPAAELWMNAQLSVTLDGKYVSTVVQGLARGTSFFGMDRMVSTQNAFDGFTSLKGGCYDLPRPALFSNVGNTPSNRSVTLNAPTPAIGGYPAAPGANVNVGEQLNFYVFARGVWVPMHEIDGDGMDAVSKVARKLELSRSHLNDLVKSLGLSRPRGEP